MAGIGVIGASILLQIEELVSASSSILTVAGVVGATTGGRAGTTRLFLAFFFWSAAARTVDPVTTDSGLGMSPDGEQGLE